MSRPPDQSTHAARETLAARERELLAALRGGPIPEGFDAAAVQRSATSLSNKRLREAARAWPAHAKWLGETWATMFATFASLRPAPGEGGPLADGRAFIDWAHTSGVKLPPFTRGAHVEMLFVRLRWRRTRGGMAPRRGLHVRAGFFRDRPRLLLAFRFAAPSAIIERHIWI
jgi:hypothetical protein